MHETPHSTPASGAETILVAEDTRIVQHLVIRLLEKAGYRVLAASSGNEALDLLRGHPDAVHLLLTDVALPGLNGPQLVEHVRASRPETAVLYMSGYAEDMVETGSSFEGETSFIQKPFSNASLLQKVRDVLDQKKASVPGVR